VLSATLLAAPLRAVDFVVTRYDDPNPDGCLPGDCSLREAALEADATGGLDRLLLSAGTYVLTRFGLGDDDGDVGDLDLHEEVEILGAGATMTTIEAQLGSLSVEPVISIGPGTLRDLAVTGSFGEGVRGFGGLTIERSEIFNNDFQGTSAGVFVTGDGTTVIRDSALVNNGRGLQAHGGILELENVTVTMSNGFQLVVASGGFLECTHCTIADSIVTNTKVRVDSSIVVFSNSIVAGLACETVAGGLLPSGGGNLESPGHTCGFNQPGDSDDEADAGLSALGDHGGTTRTFDLLAGSPAIARVPAEDCADHDQRGVDRTIHGLPCDSGAVERTSQAVPTPLFVDGFEQGDSEAWSDTVP